VARLLAAAIATAAKARASGLHGKLLCHLKTAQQVAPTPFGGDNVDEVIVG
jgi:hypothetical protein